MRTRACVVLVATPIFACNVLLDDYRNGGTTGGAGGSWAQGGSAQGGSAQGGSAQGGSAQGGGGVGGAGGVGGCVGIDTTSALAFGGLGRLDANQLASDSAGNVAIGGDFRIEFSVGTLGPVSATSTDGFAVLFNPSGEVVWAHTATGASFDHVTGVTILGNGNTVASGYQQDGLLFAGSFLPSVSGVPDKWLGHVDPSGGLVMFDVYGDGASQRGWASLAGPGSDIFYAGTSRDGNIDLGGGVVLSATGGVFRNEMFVAKLTMGGVGVWGRTFGSAHEDLRKVVAVVVDAAEDAYAAFTFDQTATVGAGITSVGVHDSFVVKLDGTSGTELWSVHVMSELGEVAQVNDVATGGGRVAVAGWFTGTVRIGALELTALDAEDAFVAIFDAANGAVVAARSFGGVGSQAAMRLDAVPAGWLIAIDTNTAISIVADCPLPLIGTDDVALAVLDPDGTAIKSVRLGGSLATGDLVATPQGASIAIEFSGTFDVAGQTLTSTDTEPDIALIRLEL